jgi:UPF0755 protein
MSNPENSSKPNAAGGSPRKNTRRRLALILLGITAIAGVMGLIQVFRIYRYIFAPNTDLRGKKVAWVYVKTGSSINAVEDSLFRHGYIINKKSFDWVARKKDLQFHINPGRYRLVNGMNNNSLVNMLRSGRQDPVRVTFQSARTAQDFAGKISHYIEADSLSILNLITDPAYLRQFNTKPATFFSIIIPDTYEFYWNTSADKFIRRMYAESRKFWTADRLRRAESTGLTVDQVVTLASIIEKETAMNDEKPDIAGVYINRMKIGMPLQADPTVIFAVNDYTIRRVLNKHIQFDSPYNTYLYRGLPPGPICIPSVASIDAVLNYNHNDYLYFCAREDFSGYHNFSKTLAQHSIYARKYQQALKAKGIR